MSLISLQKLAARLSRLAMWVAVLGVAAGCASDPAMNLTSGGEPPTTDDANAEDAEILRAGDVLKITFQGPTTIQIPDHEERIPENGQLTLRDIGKVDALGKSRVQLQDEIQKRYVPSIFRQLTVTIAPAERFFYVDGEVNKKDRFQYLGGLTVTKAIAAAGGFTDFANKRKVRLYRRGGTVEIVDCVKAETDPVTFDRKVLPGDRILVKRKLW